MIFKVYCIGLVYLHYVNRAAVIENKIKQQKNI